MKEGAEAAGKPGKYSLLSQLKSPSPGGEPLWKGFVQGRLCASLSKQKRSLGKDLPLPGNGLKIKAISPDKREQGRSESQNVIDTQSLTLLHRSREGIKKYLPPEKAQHLRKSLGLWIGGVEGGRVSMRRGQGACCRKETLR